MDIDAQRDALLIPAGEEYLVAISLDDLPQDVEDVIEILQAETAPLSVWLDIAKGYLARNGEQQFLTILKQLVGEDVAEHYEDCKFERVQAHCALAQYYINRSRDIADAKSKNIHLNDAQRHLKIASTIDANEQTVLLGQGLLEMAKGNQVAAQINFEKAKKLKCNGRPSCAGNVALAQLFFQAGKHDKAMREYMDAFRAHPNGPLCIRLGIAACAFKQLNYPLARAAYERVLSLDARNAEALAGLAALEFAAADGGSVAAGLSHLMRSFEADPLSAPVLNALASFALLRGDYSAARDAAEAATQLASSPEVLAICQCSLARACHALGNTTEAQGHYARSLRAHKTALCHYGIAQMAIEQGEVKNAMTELESVLDVVHSNVDALNLLGHLYPHAQSRADKVSRIKDAARKHTKNAKIQEILGDVLAATEPGRALEAYRAAVRLHREAESAGTAPAQALPMQLLNNAAVLEFRAGNIAEARELLLQAQEAIASGEATDLGPAALTLDYNTARAQEASGDLQRAAAGYRALLEQHPERADCLLRLACMARNRGDLEEAEEWASRAMGVEAGHDDALSLLALWHLNRKEYARTKEYTNRLLKGLGHKSDDAYGNVLAGNLHLRSAPPASRRDTKQDRQKRYQHWSSAAKHFKAALTADPGNIYAANGLGAVCAEMGQLDSARSIFSILRESAASSSGFVQLPDVWVNLGSIFLAKGEADEAVRMYSTANSKFFNNKNSEILLWLARAQYDQNKLPESKRTLLKALHIAPNNPILLFNAALTMQQFAVHVLKAPKASGDAEKLRQFTAAKVELTQACGFFERLSNMGKDKFKYPTSEQLTKHVLFCKNTLQKTESHVALAQQEVAQMEQQRRQREENMKVMRDSEALQQALAAQRAAMLRKQQDDAARVALEENKRRNEEWRHKHAQALAAKGSAKEKKRQREEAPPDEIDPAAFLAEDSEDSDYDADRAQADEQEQELEEKALRDAGYDSQDERGTADVPSPTQVSNKKRARFEQHQALDEGLEDQTLKDLGLDDDDDADAAGDVGAGVINDDLGEGSVQPAKKIHQVLDSDEDE